MSRDRREPEAIRRKKQRRRTPQEIEELRKRRKNDEMRQLQEYGEVKIKKRDQLKMIKDQEAKRNERKHLKRRRF